MLIVEPLNGPRSAGAGPAVRNSVFKLTVGLVPSFKVNGDRQSPCQS